MQGHYHTVTSHTSDTHQTPGMCLLVTLSTEDRTEQLADSQLDAELH